MDENEVVCGWCLEPVAAETAIYDATELLWLRAAAPAYCSNSCYDAAAEESFERWSEHRSGA